MSNAFVIRAKRIGPEDAALPLPSRKTEGASCIDLNLDLRASIKELPWQNRISHDEDEKFVLKAGTRAKVSVGYAFEIPKGWAGVLKIRSGIARDAGLEILGGEIDSDYRGVVEAIILNAGYAPFIIEHGARIVQMRIQPIWAGELERADELSETVRGAGGFGSTNEVSGRVSAWIQTYSGIAATPFALDPQMINVTDLARALAIKSRYNGHCRVPYSVAQHSWILSYCVPEEDAWEALLHDADEAYGGDTPGPLVKWLPDVQGLRKLIRKSLCARFGLAEQIPESVRDADLRILLNEREVLFGPSPRPWIPDIKGMKPLDLSGVPRGELNALGRILPWPWEYARTMWQQRFIELARKIGWWDK